MSERLERLLRERREALERRRNAIDGSLYGDHLRHHHLHHHQEEEVEVVLPPGPGGSNSSSQEGFHVTLGRNRSDIER